MKFLLLRCFWTHITFPPLLYFTFPLKLSCLDSSAKVSILSQKSMKNKAFGLEYKLLSVHYSPDGNGATCLSFVEKVLIGYAMTDRNTYGQALSIRQSVGYRQLPYPRSNPLQGCPCASGYTFSCLIMYHT